MKKTSKFQQIKKILENNPKIIVLRGLTHVDPEMFLYDADAFSEFFYVALKSPVWTAKELNAIKKKLIPGMKADMDNSFVDESDTFILGNLSFDEQIGEIIIENQYRLYADPDIPALRGFSGSKKTEILKQGINRRIHIFICPNLKVAKESLAQAAKGKWFMYIPKTELNRWKK